MSFFNKKKKRKITITIVPNRHRPVNDKPQVIKNLYMYIVFTLKYKTSLVLDMLI